jgi:D-alanine transaminase
VSVRFGMTVYLNGAFLPKSEAKISVEDRGFIFGDGVYEVWRLIEGQLFEHARHFARLERGLRELRITAPAEVAAGRLVEIADRLIAGNGLGSGEGTLYLEITRGVAPRAHAFPDASIAPTVFAFVNRFVPPEELRAKGATATIVPDVRWSRCDIKTIQLLPNVMAKQQAAERGAVEALFVRDGVMIEGSHSNLMAVLDGELRTHPANNFILRGITRDVVLEIARAEGITVREEAIRESDLTRVSELFLSGTTTDVTPLVKVDALTIGTGAPGPIAKRLYALLRARMAAMGRPALAAP